MSEVKTAFITGGSRGIGLGIARELAREGYAVAINGVRPESDIVEVLEELRGITSREVHYLQGNVGDPEQRQGIIGELYRRFDRLNVLVNNAGVAPRQRNDLLEMPEESYDRVMDINLKGPFFLTQAISRQMVAHRREDAGYDAYIINVGSVSATVVSENRGEYCMSKSGMGMMTQLFAARLAREGIAVYELRPGIIQTDMTRGVTEKYDRLIADGLTLQPRWGYPEDVGRATVALVRGDFRYSTGQVIMIDGGLTVPRL